MIFGAIQLCSHTNFILYAIWDGDEMRWDITFYFWWFTHGTHTQNTKTSLYVELPDFRPHTKLEMIAITQIYTMGCTPYTSSTSKKERICIYTHFTAWKSSVVTFSMIVHGPEIHKIYAKLRNASLICA